MDFLLRVYSKSFSHSITTMYLAAVRQHRQWLCLIRTYYRCYISLRAQWSNIRRLGDTDSLLQEAEQSVQRGGRHRTLADFQLDFRIIMYVVDTHLVVCRESALV